MANNERAGKPDKRHHVAFNNVLVRIIHLGMIHGYVTHVYIKHILMKYLFHHVSALWKTSADASDWLRPSATRGMINTNSTTIHQEGKTGACIILKHLVIDPSANVNQIFKPFKISKQFHCRKDLQRITCKVHFLIINDVPFHWLNFWTPGGMKRFYFNLQVPFCTSSLLSIAGTILIQVFVIQINELLHQL